MSRPVEQRISEKFFSEGNISRSDLLTFIINDLKCDPKFRHPSRNQVPGTVKITDMDGTSNDRNVSSTHYSEVYFDFGSSRPSIQRNRLIELLQIISTKRKELADLAKQNLNEEIVFALDSSNPFSGSVTLFVQQPESSIESWRIDNCTIIQQAIAELPVNDVGVVAHHSSAEDFFIDRLHFDLKKYPFVARIVQRVYATFLVEKANRYKAQRELKSLAQLVLEESMYALFLINYVPDSDIERRRFIVLKSLIEFSEIAREKLNGKLSQEQIVAYFCSSLLLVVKALSSGEADENEYYSEYRDALLTEANRLISRIGELHLRNLMQQSD